MAVVGAEQMARHAQVVFEGNPYISTTIVCWPRDRSTGMVTDIDVTRVTAIDFLHSSSADDDACTVVVLYAAPAETGRRICYIGRLHNGFRSLLTYSFCFLELRYTTHAPAHSLLCELVAFYVQDDYDMVAITALRDAHGAVHARHHRTATTIFHYQGMVRRKSRMVLALRARSTVHVSAAAQALVFVAHVPPTTRPRADDAFVVKVGKRRRSCVIADCLLCFFQLRQRNEPCLQVVRG